MSKEENNLNEIDWEIIHAIDKNNQKGSNEQDNGKKNEEHDEEMEKDEGEMSMVHEEQFADRVVIGDVATSSVELDKAILCDNSREDSFRNIRDTPSYSPITKKVAQNMITRTSNKNERNCEREDTTEEVSEQENAETIIMMEKSRQTSSREIHSQEEKVPTTEVLPSPSFDVMEPGNGTPFSQLSTPTKMSFLNLLLKRRTKKRKR